MLTENELLEAITTINEFCRENYEYGDEYEGQDFTDLYQVNIAGMETEDGEYDIDVNVNLIDCQIEYVVGDKIYRIIKATNLGELLWIIGSNSFEGFMAMLDANDTEFAEEYHGETLFSLNKNQ